MKDRILEFVKERRGRVTFAELVHLLGEEARGECALGWARYENIVFWTGMSEEFYKAIVDLLAEELIHLTPSMPLIYIIDGLCLTLPTAKRRQDYKSLHWLPVVINLGPPEEGKGG